MLSHVGREAPWAALAFLLTPDDRLQEPSPLAVLRSQDERLKELTLRLTLSRVMASVEELPPPPAPIPGALNDGVSIPRTQQRVAIYPLTRQSQAILPSRNRIASPFLLNRNLHRTPKVGSAGSPRDTRCVHGRMFETSGSTR